MRDIEILVVGSGMKLSCRDRDSLLFVGRMWEILNLKAGCEMTYSSKRGAGLYFSRQNLGLAKKNKRRNNDTIAIEVMG